MNDARRDAPSFHRNIEPITQKLHEILPNDCKHVLDIGSGTGQHVARFSEEFPQIQFQPTEYDIDNLASINAWSEGRNNVSPARQLDVTQIKWFDKTNPKFDVLLCFNVIHITPFEVTQGIFKGAQKTMRENCQLIFYGPFKIDSKHTSESNQEFEKWLKDKDVSFGIRDIGDVETEARANGFGLFESHTMPANNFLNVFTRSSQSA